MCSILAIVNLYLTSCVQYFAFAAAMVFCGKAARRVLALKNEAPVRVTPYMLNPPAEATGSDYTDEVEPEDDDTGLAEQQALGHVLKTGEWRWFPCSKQSGFIVPSAGIKPVIESGRIRF